MNIKLTDDSNPFYYKLTKKHISSYHEDNSYNNDSPSDIYGSTYNYIYFNLNNGLEYIFRDTGCRDYHLAAFDGKVYSINQVEKAPEPPRQFSLYGE